MQTYFERSSRRKSSFIVKIADIPIQIEAKYDYIFFCCQDYLSTEEPLFHVDVSQEELEEEILNSKAYYYISTGFGVNSENHKITKEINKGIIESVIIHRKIAEKVPSYNTFFMHGAVIAVANNAFMFTGRSGTGKTTHIKKWIKNAEGSFVVNGDKPFVIVDQKGVFACGSPWCGKENYGTNKIVPLRSIVFMERSSENHIEKTSFKSIFKELVEQTYQPSDANQMRKTLEHLMRLSDQVSFYKFHFNNFKEDSFNISFNALTSMT